MSTQETTTTEAETSQARRWAVIQTGYIDATFNPVKLTDGKGRSIAVLIKVCKDEADARRMMKRLRTVHSRVEWLPGSDFGLAVPIYGVAETDIPFAKPKPKPAAGGTDGSAASDGASGGGRRRGRKAESV